VTAKRIKERYGEIIILIVGIAILFLAIVWARSFFGARECYLKAEEQLQKGNYIRAVTFYDRSLHWYTPFNPYIERAAQRLWEIGNRAEEQGDTKLALIAYRTIRHSFYAARSFYTPGKDWISKCETRIAALAGSQLRSKYEKNQLISGFAIKSQVVLGPSVLWSAVVVFSFFGWVGSVIAIIFFSLRPPRKIRKISSSALPWTGLGLFFFALWIVGMLKA